MCHPLPNITATYRITSLGLLITGLCEKFMNYSLILDIFFTKTFLSLIYNFCTLCALSFVWSYIFSELIRSKHNWIEPENLIRNQSLGTENIVGILVPCSLPRKILDFFAMSSKIWSFKTFEMTFLGAFFFFLIGLERLRPLAYC